VIYLEWGTYHLRSPHEAWDMARANRDLWALLRQRGQRPAGGEVPEGFGWACWRGHTDEMLSALFPLRPE
jgi:enterochelin esterase-like enzyme